MSLDKINIGDKVILTRRFSDNEVRVIKRKTSTTLMIEGATPGTERKFRITDGYEKGMQGSYYIARIVPYTEELNNTIIKKQKISKINSAKFHFTENHQTDLVNEVYHLLFESKKYPVL